MTIQGLNKRREGLTTAGLLNKNEELPVVEQKEEVVSEIIPQEVKPQIQEEQSKVIHTKTTKPKTNNKQEKANFNIIVKENVSKKKYANFYLQETTIDMINELQKKTGLAKSELVDTLIRESLKEVEISKR